MIVRSLYQTGGSEPIGLGFGLPVGMVSQNPSSKTTVTKSCAFSNPMFNAVRLDMFDIGNAISENSVPLPSLKKPKNGILSLLVTS